MKWEWGPVFVLVLVIGLALYLRGVFGLLRLGLTWLCRRAGRWLPVVLVLILPGIAGATSEVRTTCYERTFYQALSDFRSTWFGARIWSIELCGLFEHTENADGTTHVRPLGPATITWNPFGLYKTMWNADDCEAWISPETESGQFVVRGKCTVRFAFLPFIGSLKGDLVQKDIWVGFTQGYLYTDYWYSERIHFLHEASDPLPL